MKSYMLAVAFLVILSAIPSFGQGAPTSKHIFYIDAKNHVDMFWQEYIASEGVFAWEWQDLTATTGAPAPISGSRLTSFGDIFGGHVIYLGASQHVYQLYWNPSSNSWGYGDLTSTAGAPAAVAGTQLTSFSDSPGEHVIYSGTNNHVYQLYFNAGLLKWGYGDLTATAGAPSAVSKSPLASFVDSPGEHILFLGTNQHIYQLYWNSGNHEWGYGDLTAATGNTLAATNTTLTGFADSSNVEHVGYLGPNQHVYELYDNGSWHNRDLSALTGNTLALSGGVISGFYDKSDAYYGPGGEHYFYVGAKQHIDLLLSTNGGSSWTNTDITAAIGGSQVGAVVVIGAGVTSTPGSDPGCCSSPVLYDEVDFVAIGQYLYGYSYVPSKWISTDYSQNPNGPPGDYYPLVASGSSLTGYIR